MDNNQIDNVTKMGINSSYHHSKSLNNLKWIQNVYANPERLMNFNRCHDTEFRK